MPKGRLEVLCWWHAVRVEEDVEAASAEFVVQLHRQSSGVVAPIANEYAALPTQSHEFMPVGIEVGLTESRSEQPALLALASVMKQSSGFIGATAGQFAQIPRSVPLAAQGPLDPEQGLVQARSAWHDARVALKIADSPQEQARATSTLSHARAAYSQVRLQAGLTAELMQ